MNHPDFRVREKIFATLLADESWGVIMLTPEQQAVLVSNDPATFVPAKGAWGRAGSTQVFLKTARSELVREALRNAWMNKAPKTLAAQFDGLASR